MAYRGGDRVWGVLVGGVVAVLLLGVLPAVAANNGGLDAFAAYSSTGNRVWLNG